MSIRRKLLTAAHFFFSYSTVRRTRIHSWKIASLYWLFQLVIILWIVGFNIIYNKGYQTVDSVTSVITTKVKGYGYVRKKYSSGDHADNMQTLEADSRIFDTADFVIPASELTPTAQYRIRTRGIGEVNSYSYIMMSQNKHQANKYTKKAFPTGKCINSTSNASVNVCELISWCPMEREIKGDKSNVIQNVLNYTIFIKNDIQFKQLQQREHNLLNNMTNDFISSCIYDRAKNPVCPVFLVKKILEESESDELEREQMLERGGVIQIEISWDCDYDSRRPCLPQYAFSRYDIPFKSASASSGFNFRYADKFEINSKPHRTLVKAYGLRFIITVHGIGRRFDMVPLFINIGAGIGFLSIATLMADFVLVNFTKNRKTYKRITELKYTEVNEVFSNLPGSLTNLDKNRKEGEEEEGEEEESEDNDVNLLDTNVSRC